MDVARISHLEFPVFAEGFQIIIGEPRGIKYTGVDPAHVFFFHSDTLMSIQTVSGLTATVILQEWTGVPKEDPEGWNTWEAETYGHLHVHQVMVASPSGGFAALEGFSMKHESGRFNVRARAQGHLEVLELEAAGVDEWPEPGPEKYLLQFWPADA